MAMEGWKAVSVAKDGGILVVSMEKNR